MTLFVNFTLSSDLRTRSQRNGENQMLKTLACFVSGLLLFVTVSQPVLAQQGAKTLEQIKIKVGRLGVGEKAKATIRLKDGTKTKGYIYRAGEDDFVIRDRKTDTPTTIRYSDVAKVESNKGHSMARNIAIGVGIGAGALLAIIFITIAALD
jgi:preprotein translocase subunit SecF